MNRLAPVLAVLAVLAVLGTTVAAALTYRGRDSEVAGPSAGPMIEQPSGQPTAEPSVDAATPYAAFPDEQVVYGQLEDNAMFEVPARRTGWRVSSADTFIYYADADGNPVEGVDGAAVFRQDYCPEAEGASNRGFVGFGRVSAGVTARQAGEALSKRWVGAIALDPETGRSARHTPIEVTDVSLRDGSPAVRASATIEVGSHKPCDPPRVRFTMLSVDTGDAVANLVMVRDAGEPGVLAADTAEQILGTLQQQIR